MKKLISMLLVAVMLTVITACNSAPAQNEGENVSRAEATPSQAVSEESAEEPTAPNPADDVLPKDAELYVYCDQDPESHSLDFKTDFGTENRLATEDDIKEHEEAIGNLKVSEIKRFYVCSYPNFKEEDSTAEIAEKEFRSLFGIIKELKVKPTEEVIPTTGGGWHCYIETADTAYFMFCNGDYLTVAQQGKENDIIFKCEDILGDKIGQEINMLMMPLPTMDGYEEPPIPKEY